LQDLNFFLVLAESFIVRDTTRGAPRRKGFGRAKARLVRILRSAPQ